MLVRIAFLLLCALILPVYGNFTYSYNLSSKEGTVTGYDGTDENVVIPSTFRVSEKYGSSCMTVGGFPLHKFAWPLFYGLLSRSSGPRNFD